MASHRARILLGVLVIFPAFMPASADVYRWVDTDGRVHFGDRPPADTQAEQIQVGEGASVSGDLEERGDRRERFLDVMEEQREEDARAASERTREADKHRKNCAIASDRLRQIQDARFIFEPTADPDNPRILDESERAEYLARARKDVATWCR